MKFKKILVAGGAGFLGSNLCEALLKRKLDVYCLDNFHTGNYENIKKFIKKKNFKLINHDINKPIELDVDGIFNLACPASPPKYQKNQLSTILTSFNGTLNLLKLAKKNKIKFFQASTSEIYGNPLEHPQNENYNGNVNTFGPRACYDEGKRAAESLCYIFMKQHNVNINIVRIFNTYGPKMDITDGRVVTNFINSALSNKDLEIYGNGNQTRSFCYVDDLINGFIKVFFNKLNINTPINLGNPKEYNMLELADMVLRLSKSKSKIKFKKLPTDDPLKRKPDIKKAKLLIKWKPVIQLEDGITKTIKYFKERI